MKEKSSVEYWMEHAGVKPLSEFQKQDLRKKKQAYEQLKAELQQEILALKGVVTALETKIENVPGVRGATSVHDGYRGCGLRTAIYSGTTPQGGLAGGDDTRYCLFCERYVD